MSRINYRLLIYYFLLYVVVQLPLLWKFVLWDVAFAFFYVGFLLFFPLIPNRVVRLLTGFFTGLLIDTFSNTPGLHAGAATLIMYIREYWLLVTVGDLEDELNLNLNTIGWLNLIIYILPLILIHHGFIFLVEHGKTSGLGIVFERILKSTLLTGACVLVVNIVLTRRRRRN